MKNDNINIGYKLYHAFDHLKTCACEKYEDYMTDFVLTEAGDSDTIGEPLFSVIVRHISECRYCENVYYITRNIMLDQTIQDITGENETYSFIPSPGVIVSMNRYYFTGMLRELPCGDDGTPDLEPLGVLELDVPVNDSPNHFFRLTLYRDDFDDSFHFDFYSRNEISRFEVIYDDGENHMVLFDNNTIGAVGPDQQLNWMPLDKINSVNFKWKQISRDGLNNRIYIQL